MRLRPLSGARACCSLMACMAMSVSCFSELIGTTLQVAQRIMAVELAPVLLSSLPNPYDPSSAIATFDSQATSSEVCFMAELLIVSGPRLICLTCKLVAPFSSSYRLHYSLCSSMLPDLTADAFSPCSAESTDSC